MDSRTQDRVENWDSKPFSGGVDGLRELADTGFSGTVSSGGSWLFMLNGRIIGIVDGSLDSFDGASGTVYEAPDPALSLLYMMQEQGGETQAKYYTNDTSIREADRTLSDASFTGFVELSENVLSGDYYVCYYGGRKLPVAFIGNSERLVTGDDAFEKANDEVGIFEVRKVDIDIVELPEPDGASDDAPAGNVQTDAQDSEPADDAVPAPETGAAGDAPETTADTPESTPDAPETTDDDPSPATGRANRSDAADANGGVDDAGAPASSNSPVTEAEPSSEPSSTGGKSFIEAAAEEVTGESVTPRADETTESEQSAGRGQTGSSRSQTEAGRSEPQGSASDSPPGSGNGSATGANAGGATARNETGADASAPDPDDPTTERFQQEEAWRKKRSIPSIDPDRSKSPSSRRTKQRNPGAGTNQPSRTQPSSASGSGASNQSRTGQRTGHESKASQSGRSDQSQPSQSAPSTSEESEPLKREVLEREDKIDRLQQRVSDLEGKRDELQSARERLEQENGRLEDEKAALEETVGELEGTIEDLQREVTRLERTVEEERATAGPGSSRPQQLTPQQAIDGTNLFVRYDSKGQATLEDAHGGANPNKVNENLRIEHHTQFEAGDVSVDGIPFEEFLTGTVQFQFVDWAIRDLIFEIRDTGNRDGLRDLYDALPSVDRAELNGVVEIADEEGEIVAEEQFDVILRDRMGHPLVVANLNDSRDPATEHMMVSLNDSSTGVKHANEELGAAFMVTTSFFEPGALETASEATSGSFLSRDSRKSFVKLSRKAGYHLCLVETRDGNFHVNVPEL